MSAHALGQMLLGLAAIIVLARAFGALARKVGQPPVIGEIVAGVVVGPTLFGTAVVDTLFPAAEVRPALSGLANVGLVLFMFIVGYELDHRLVRGRERVAVAVSLGSIVLPFSLGAILALWLAERHHITDKLPFVLFLGAAMSVTAFPVLARILTDRGMQRTAVGGLALASAAVDDVMAWSILAVVIAVGGSDAATWHTALAVPYVVLMLTVVRPLLRRLVTARDRAGRLTPGLLSIVLIGLLLSGYAAEWLGVHAIFGAFLFGVVMPRGQGGERFRHEVFERLEQVSVLLLLPAFFFLSGLRVDLSTVDLNGVLELALILFVAIAGKGVGAFVGARSQGVPARQSGVLATLMNTRGLTEIVILTVGLQLGILSGELFSLMVVMALVTTVMAGPILAVIYPKRRIEQDIAEAERNALGLPEGYRIMVLTGGDCDEAAVEVAGDLAGARRPAEVVLSGLVPYADPGRLEVGTGLSGELTELADRMERLDRLAGPVRGRGLGTAVLVRLSTDLPRDVRDHAAAAGAGTLVLTPDFSGYAAVAADPPARLVTVHGPLPAQPAGVWLSAESGPDWDAAAEVAVALAATRRLPLVVSGSSRAARRLVEAVDRSGVEVRTGIVDDESAWLVVVEHNAQQTAGRLAVRSVGESTGPAEWVPAVVGVRTAAVEG